MISNPAHLELSKLVSVYPEILQFLVDNKPSSLWISDLLDPNKDCIDVNYSKVIRTFNGDLELTGPDCFLQGFSSTDAVKIKTNITENQENKTQWTYVLTRKAFDFQQELQIFFYSIIDKKAGLKKLIGGFKELDFVKPKLQAPQGILPNSILESDSLYVFKMDANGSYTYVNDFYCIDFGFKKEEIIGKSTALGVVEEDIKVCYEIAKKCFSEPNIRHSAIIKKADKSGNIKTGKWEFIAFPNQNGNIEEILCLGQDITALKNIENQLKSEQTLRDKIIELLPLNIYIKDREFKKTLVNKSEVEFCGANSPEEVLGKTDFDLYDEETAKLTYAIDKEVIEGKSWVSEVEIVKSKNGKPVHLISSKVPLLDTDGTVSGILGLSMDITEKFEQDEKIKFQSDLLNQIGESVIATDTNGEVIFWNKAAEELFGWRQEEVLGKDILNLTPVEELKEEAFQIFNNALDDENWAGIFKVKTKDKGLKFIKIKNSSLKNEKGEIVGVVGISTDITNLEKVQADLYRSKDLLDNAGELARVGAYAIDFRLGSVEWSKVTKSIHGLSPDEQPNLAEAINFYKEGEWRELVQSTVSHAIQEGKSFEFESILVTKNEEEKWVRANGKPIIEDGECVYLYGSIQDITEEKLKQSVIEESRKELKNLSDGVSGVLFKLKMTNEGYFSWSYISERIGALLGYTPEDFYKEPTLIMKLVDPKNISDILLKIKESASSKSFFSYETKVITKEGIEKWVLTEAFSRVENDRTIKWSGYAQDITENKLGQLELQNTRYQLESILNSMSEVVYSVELPSGKLLFITPSAEKLFGRPLIDFENDPEAWIDHIVEDDKWTVENNYKTLSETGSFSSAVRISDSKTGEIKWVSLFGKFIFNEEGIPVRTLGVTKDITESKLKELELVLSEEKFRSYVENSPNVIFTHDLNGNIKYISPNGQKDIDSLGLFGDSYNINSLIHPEDKEIALVPLKKLISEKVNVASPPFRVAVGSGKWEWRVIHGSPILDVNGNVIEVLANSIDVHQLVENQIALKKSEQYSRTLARHYEALLGTQSVFVVKTDLLGNYTYISESFVKVFGVDKKVIGTNSLESIVPEDWEKCKETVMKCFSQPEISHKIVLRKPTSEGVIKFGNWEFIGKVNDLGMVEEILCIGYDISELMETFEKTNKLLNLTSDQNNRLQNFAYIVSHNIRSHSANFQGILKLFEDPINEEEKAEYFQMLVSSADRLDETIRNLNEVITSSREIEKPKEKRNIWMEVMKTIEIFKESLTLNKVELEVDIDKNIEILVVPAYLDSIILNLISNAVKFKSNERTCRISIVSEIQKDFVLVSFTDNGRGIDLKKASKNLFGIFKTFHQGTDSRGMGLYLTRNQIESMGGRIEVESKVNVGTTFKVYFSNEV